ncbi:MAG: DUF4328 domain-containing protein [Acidimicrobiia bacterium]
MSDRPQGDDWWLASDGKWYPPQSRTQPPPPSTAAIPSQPVPAASYGAPTPTAPQPGVQSSRRYVSAGLNGTLFAFQIAAAALAMLAGVMYLGTYALWQDYRNGGPTSFSEVLDVADASDAVAGVWAICALVVFILLVIWCNHAYKAALSRGPSRTSWSSGWAVGGWFIPLANFVIPKLVINEIDRMAQPHLEEPIGDSWRSQRRTAVSDVWWVFWIVGIVVSQIGDTLATSDIELLWVSTVGYLILGTGFILGAIAIRKIGKRLTPR